MGPKHGPARGVAVFRSVGSKNYKVVDGVALQWDSLHSWALEHGLDLRDDVSSLEALDSRLNEWYRDDSHFEKVNLPVDVGAFLGQLIVTNREGARWVVWPNAHPVVRLPSGRDLDVTAIAGERILHHTSSLQSTFAEVMVE